MKPGDIFKQMLLGGAAGRFAESMRDSLAILEAAIGRSEGIGTLANDQLATFLVCRLCRPNATFVDVGAHIGSVVANVVRHDRTINIVAVEAMPDKAAYLRRKFPRIAVHECAAGDREGRVSFFVNLEQSGYSSLAPGWGANAGGLKEITVELRKLDGLVALTDIDVVKIDVEGAELGVLRGAQDLLSRCRPIIMFESGPEERLGHTKVALWEFLADRRYAIIVPNRLAHNDDGLPLEGFIESHLYPRRTTNYFAVPRERRIEARDRARKLLGIPAPA